MASSSTPADVDHLRSRVRLYLQVMLTIAVLAHVSDWVTPLFVSDFEQAPLPPREVALRWGITATLALAWAGIALLSPGRRALVALESAITIGLIAVYVHLGMAFAATVMPAYEAAYGLLGLPLLLAVRAAVVPSPLLRTSIIGAVSLGWYILRARASLATLHPVIADGLVFMGGAFVVASAVTSHVIYGLRRQVRHAMRLGQYELGRKLGEGGMGVVYEATHVMLRRPTAVKLLPIETAGAATIARFEREVRQTSRLEHPNSVYIYDYGRTPDGQFYYAMELLEGATLAELVRSGGPISAPRAVHLLRQAAAALAEAHDKGLVHRDVKPANIMVCVRAGVPDTVKVLDFGLVKEVDAPADDGGITQASAIVGTPHYLAPEAISSADAVGPATDVYALGAVGYFLVTGREVFTGKTVIEICSQHLKDAPETPSEALGAPVDERLEALILRCLAKSPDERPSDGGALVAALDARDMPDWTLEDSRAAWAEHPIDAVRASDGLRTQLTVDIDRRR